MFYNTFKYLIGTLSSLFTIIYLYFNLYLKYYFQYKYLYRKLEEIPHSKDNFIYDKIVDYNMHYGCDFYEKNKIIEIIDFLKKEEAEIYILQEFPNIKFQNNRDLLFYFKSILNMNYVHKEVIVVVGNIEYCIIILSKKEIEDVKVLEFNKWFLRLNNICLSVKTNKYWLSNLHLNSDITGYCQQFQVKELLNYVKNINESHIILGDFNTPESYKALKYLKKNLNYINFRNKTYPSILPVVKLDHCFTFKFDKEVSIGVKKLKYSDHLPLIITID